MSNEELKAKIEGLLADQGAFRIKDVMHVNHKPHPYMIGPSHVAWAADHWGGGLSEECIRDGEKRGVVRCYNSPPREGRCNIPYDEHTSDRVVFLQLRRNVANAEAVNILFTIKQAILDEKVTGFCFVDTPEKFRIEEPTTSVNA